MFTQPFKLSQYVGTFALHNSHQQKNVIQWIKNFMYSDQQLAGNNVKKLLPFLVYTFIYCFVIIEPCLPLNTKYLCIFFSNNKNKNWI